MHVAPVFAPARIQENIPGELFMYWFRARGYFGVCSFVLQKLVREIAVNYDK